MSEFNPSPDDRIVVRGQVYSVKPHPAVPTFAFGQEGRKAFVYQIAMENGELYALKKFKQAYRLPDLVDICNSLAQYAGWSGLEACGRECFQFGIHDDVLSQFPDLEYAVLMPWVSGRTWYDLVIGMTPLKRIEAVTFANSTAQVLSALEESSIAHCDIAAANVIVNPTTGRAHLIDVEDIFAPGLARPVAVPAGTDGYAHKTSHQGQWEPAADRFAGGVIISEMIAWFHPDIRKQADEEHYFDATKMQADSPRYQLMRAVLDELDPRLPEVFDRMWFSDTLEDCPRLSEWHDIIEDIYHRERLSEVVSDWQPLVAPQDMEVAAPRPFVAAPAPQSQPEAVEMLEDDSPLEDEQVIAAPLQASVPSSPPPVIPIQPIPTPMTQSPEVNDDYGPVKEWRSLAIPPPPSPIVAGNGFVPTTAEPAPIEEPIAPEQPAPIDEESYIDIPVPADLIDKVEEDDMVEMMAGEEAAIVSFEEEPDPPIMVAERVKTSTLPIPKIILSYDNNQPILFWSESIGANHYIIEESRKLDFDNPKEIIIEGRQNTSFRPGRRISIGRRKKQFYRVRACSDDEMSEWSDILET